MKWTDKQFEAISDRGHNLLVAAAAGSGKTAVLVERIKTLILKDGCPIDRMLVVTFTNAAASEMKEKIEKAIREEITGLSVSQDADKNRKISILKRQLDLLPMANISTFHSFSMEVVKRFFFVIGCEPNFKICDEANKVILEDRAMDKLMERRYEEGGEAFTGLAAPKLGSGFERPFQIGGGERNRLFLVGKVEHRGITALAVLARREPAAGRFCGAHRMGAPAFLFNG